MFRNLTYKQKLKFVGIAGILALVLCYRLSISRTIDEYKKYETQASLYGNQSGDAMSSAALKARGGRIDSLMTQYSLDTLLPEKNLLQVASNYCKTNNLQLKEYKPYGLSRTDNILVLTRTVTVGGAFIPCLRFLYALEKTRQVGRISATEFKSFTDPLDKKLKLDCTIYIQNLISPNHEVH